MGKGNFYGPMEGIMKESMWRGESREGGDLCGKGESIMRENGRMESSMEMEFIRGVIKLKGRECGLKERGFIGLKIDIFK